MARRVIKLPDIGEGVAEAEIVAWHVAVGDAVAEDQPLVDVMTDKSTVEIPSPASGKILALGGAVGEMLAVGSELVQLDVAGEVATAPVATGSAAADSMAVTVELPVEVSVTPPPPAAMVATPPVAPRPAGEKPLASPAVRRRALEAGIDLRQVPGRGPAGRIGHSDLDAFTAARDQVAEAAPAARRARTGVEEVRVIGLRRRIAQKMADATRRIAHFSYIEEIDVAGIEELRATLNARHGGSRPRLTLIPFLVQALVRALPEFPQMNALYDDEAEIIRRHAGIHVGIATQTPAGLLVPVLRHAEARDLWDMAAEIRRLAEAARTGVAARDELAGSTITITSLGALGGLATTPVINRPEVAIIGVNKQAIRPLWRDGGFVPRLMMNLSASFDHRVIDGHDAARFIQAVKGLLETPATLFMEA